MKETIPRAESIIEMLPEKIRPRVRVNFQEELEKRMREINRDREDRKILEKMKKDREIAYLHSDKTGKIVIMERNEYENRWERPLLKWVQKEWQRIQMKV